MTGLMVGKVALVTGAGSGIGRAIAQHFAQEGVKVVVADCSKEGGEQTVDLIRNAGGEASFIKIDVSNEGDVQKMVQYCLDNYGSLNFAVNNAGTNGPIGPLIDVKVEDYDQVIAVNMRSVFLGLKYEVRQMLQQGGGVIVNTASIGGLIGTPGLIPYTASKHGVIGLTRTCALEYAKNNIRINAICPGLVETPLTDHPEIKQQLRATIPMDRFGTTDEIAAMVVFLCSDAAAFITGAVIPVDGGTTAA